MIEELERSAIRGLAELVAAELGVGFPSADPEVFRVGVDVLPSVGSPEYAELLSAVEDRVHPRVRDAMAGELEALLGAVDRLRSSAQSQFCALHYFQGLSLEETAIAMGNSSEAWVKGLRDRAVEGLVGQLLAGVVRRADLDLRERYETEVLARAEAVAYQLVEQNIVELDGLQQDRLVRDATAEVLARAGSALESGEAVEVGPRLNAVVAQVTRRHAESARLRGRVWLALPEDLRIGTEGRALAEMDRRELRQRLDTLLPSERKCIMLRFGQAEQWSVEETARAMELGAVAFRAFELYVLRKLAGMPAVGSSASVDATGVVRSAAAMALVTAARGENRRLDMLREAIGRLDNRDEQLCLQLRLVQEMSSARTAAEMGGGRTEGDINALERQGARNLLDLLPVEADEASAVVEVARWLYPAELAAAITRLEGAEQRENAEKQFLAGMSVEAVAVSVGKTKKTVLLAQRQSAVELARSFPVFDVAAAAEAAVVGDVDPVAVARVARRYERATLELAVSRLDHDTARQVAEMTLLQDMPNADVAVAMRKSKSAISNMLRRAALDLVEPLSGAEIPAFTDALAIADVARWLYPVELAEAISRIGNAAQRAVAERRFSAGMPFAATVESMGESARAVYEWQRHAAVRVVRAFPFFDVRAAAAAAVAGDIEPLAAARVAGWYDAPALSHAIAGLNSAMVRESAEKRLLEGISILHTARETGKTVPHIHRLLGRATSDIVIALASAEIPTVTEALAVVEVARFLYPAEFAAAIRRLEAPLERAVAERHFVAGSPLEVTAAAVDQSERTVYQLSVWAARQLVASFPVIDVRAAAVAAVAGDVDAQAVVRVARRYCRLALVQAIDGLDDAALRACAEEHFLAEGLLPVMGPQAAMSETAAFTVREDTARLLVAALSLAELDNPVFHVGVDVLPAVGSPEYAALLSAVEGRVPPRVREVMGVISRRCCV